MKQLLLIFVAAFSFLVCCSGGEAADWKPVGTSEDDSASLYVDVDSISSVSRNQIRAWTKFLFEKPESFESRSLTQFLAHMEYDCTDNKTRMLELVFRYDDGSEEAFSLERDWRSVKAGTLENELIHYLCR